jgi:hypothetical protein
MIFVYKRGESRCFEHGAAVHTRRSADASRFAQMGARRASSLTRSRHASRSSATASTWPSLTPSRSRAR